ncbi:MAG: hypothetical protein ABI658_19260 [Acidimicrobiales bacterium]
MNKRIAAAAASASLLAGAAGFAIGVTGTAGAQSGSPTTTAPAAKPKSDGWIQDALKPLLDNGTLNQSQIDAVTKALQDARPAGKGPMDGGLRRGGPGGGGPAGNLAGAATALGVTAEEVRTALQSGQSLADLAKAKGVDPQKVIDALLAPIVEHEKADVTSGKDTQAEADKEIADATARITDFVNGKAPAKGAGIPKGGARPGGRGKAPAAPTTTAPAGS